MYFFQPGYWNLSNDVQGCEACNCDIGGAYSHSCDQSTGHCKCRPNVIGRLCDQIRPGYFITTLDWQRYEAETASGFGVSVSDTWCAYAVQETETLLASW